MGKYQQQLEKELSKFLGLKNVVLFSSCRNTLYTLLLSLNLKKSDEIIIQSFICDSLPLAIEKAGATVIKVEVDTNTFNLSADLVEKKLNKNTQAIIFVHTYGNPSGIKEIKELCEKHKIILIEDIAHALGASYGGKLAGTFGDYAVYSFTKQMVNFGGGALISNHNLGEVQKIKDSFHQPAVYFTYIQRLLASLYETRAFFLSKLLIDLAHKKNDLKKVQKLDLSFSCSNLEAYLALRQLSSLSQKIIQRKNNFIFLQETVPMQKIDSNADSSYNYLSFIFPFSISSLDIKKAHFLFSYPWSGSKISSQIIFLPNSTLFSNKKLSFFIKIYTKIYESKAKLIRL